MIAILPLLLYPALGIGMMQLTVLFQEQPRTIVILNAKDLPEPALLDGQRFDKRWFRQGDDAEKLIVISDLSPAVVDENPSTAELAQQARQTKLLENARTLAEKLAPTHWPQGTKDALTTKIALPELSKQFSASGIQVLVIVPPDFREQMASFDRSLQERSLEKPDRPARERPLILHNTADEKSMIAYTRVNQVLDRWEQEVSGQQLKASGLPDYLPTPIHPYPVDLAEQEQLSANIWSKLFPALLIIMALTGAFYPAIDLCAGEKERGTMETLLICPASRSDIVLGKFLTVLLFSMSTALLNLLSLGFTGKYMVSLGTSSAMSRLGDLSLPPASSLAWVIVMLIPLSALFSALCLALATFAKSTKEGQYYLTPLLMVTLGLTIFCLSPGVEIEPFYSIMPVMGPALLLKGFLKETGAPGELLLYLAPVLITSFGYGLLALWWAIDQFSSEDVLFREAERLDLRLWVRHLMRDKEATPSFAEATFCFVVIMLLQFLAMRAFQTPLSTVSASQRGTLMMQLLIIQQLVIVATPALLMAVMLTTNFAKTLRLRWPSLKGLLIGALLPFLLHPLSIELAGHLRWFFPQLPRSIVELLTQMADGSQPLWLTLLAFAIAPGICEELAFRGFLLSGFARPGRIGLGIVLSALTFGIMHLIPQQVFNAALLGLVLGLIAIKTDSLIPGIVFHIFYNGLEVLRHRFLTSIPVGGTWDHLWLISEGEMRYQPLLLVVCLVSATGLLAWLALSPQRPLPAKSQLAPSLGN